MCSHTLFLQIGVLSPGRSNNNWKMKTAFASPSQTATVTKVRLFGLWTGERIMGKWTQRAVRELGQKIMDGPVSSRTQGSECPQLGNAQVRHELIGESMNTNMWLFSGRDFSVGERPVGFHVQPSESTVGVSCFPHLPEVVYLSEHHLSGADDD